MMQTQWHKAQNKQTACCCGVDGLLPQQWTPISHCHPHLTVMTELL